MAYTEKDHFEHVDNGIRHNFVDFYLKVKDYLEQNYDGIDFVPVKYYISIKLNKRVVGQFRFNKREINWEMKIDNVSNDNLDYLYKEFDMRIAFFPKTEPRNAQKKWMTLHIEESDVLSEMKYNHIIHAFKIILNS